MRLGINFIACKFANASSHWGEGSILREIWASSAFLKTKVCSSLHRWLAFFTFWYGIAAVGSSDLVSCYLAPVLWKCIFNCVLCRKLNLILKTMKPNSEKPKLKYISDLKATKINVRWYLFCVSVVHLNFVEFMNIWQRERLKICNMLVIRLMIFMHLLEIIIALSPFFSGPICWAKPFCSGSCCVSSLLCFGESCELLKGQKQVCDLRGGDCGISQRRGGRCWFSLLTWFLWKAIRKSSPCSSF